VSEEEKIQVGVVLEGEVKKRFEAIKRYYGLEKNADLIRVLLKERYEQLKEAESEPPRLEQINFDDNGMKIHDRQLCKVVTVYFKPTGIFCDEDQSDQCEHIDFALSLSTVKNHIRKRRKEGWKLPEV
jgi:hypothetical protein